MKSSSQLLEFHAGGHTYACDLLWIREILRQPTTTPVPCAPPFVRGLIHLRGQILTALDLEARLGLPLRDPAQSSRCIVFKTAADLARLPVQPADSAQAKGDLVGVVVDSIGDIIPPGSEILPPPPDQLSGLDRDCIAGVITRKGTLATVLHIGSLLELPESLTATTP